MEKIELKEGERKIEISPKDTFEVDLNWNLKIKLLVTKEIILIFKENLSEVEESRTFCLYKDIQKIKKWV